VSNKHQDGLNLNHLNRVSFIMSRMLFLYEIAVYSFHAISMPYKGRSSRFTLEHSFPKRKTCE
jgi:hypothetical protein